MIRKILLAIFCVATLNANTLNIAVAANVSYAMDELKKEFYKLYPNIELQVTLGSSGKLTAQISHGASYEVFMSANMRYPESLYEQKLAISKPMVYAKGALALLSVKKLDFSQNLELLKSDTISKIAIANPKTAPYGKAAFEALTKAKLLEELKPKFVYGESISQTISYAISAADIGIVAKSSLFSPKMSAYKKDENWIDIDSSLYSPIDQGIVILKETPQARKFYEFILSQKAKEIFKAYGYEVE